MPRCSHDDSLTLPHGSNLEGLNMIVPTVELGIGEISEEVSFPPPSFPIPHLEESIWIGEMIVREDVLI